MFSRVCLLLKKYRNLKFQSLKNIYKNEQSVCHLFVVCMYKCMCLTLMNYEPIENDENWAVPTVWLRYQLIVKIFTHREPVYLYDEFVKQSFTTRRKPLKGNFFDNSKGKIGKQKLDICNKLRLMTSIKDSRIDTDIPMDRLRKTLMRFFTYSTTTMMMSWVVMGPGQNFLTLVVSGQFFVAQGGFGFEFGKFPLIASNFWNFLPSVWNKSLRVGSKACRPLIYCKPVYLYDEFICKAKFYNKKKAFERQLFW